MVSYTFKDSIISILHSFTWMFGLLAKVVGSYYVDPGSIPGNLQLRQKSVVGQEIGNFWLFFTWYFSPILNFKASRQNGYSISFWRFGESHIVHWVPRKMAMTLQKDSAPALIEPISLFTTSLNHSSIGAYWFLEKNSIWLFMLLYVFSNFLGAELSISDSSDWISRLGKQYQNSWT